MQVALKIIKIMFQALIIMGITFIGNKIQMIFDI
ncbi:CidA/LrgA family protein, partial [Staphylococcus cohnii]